MFSKKPDNAMAKTFSTTTARTGSSSFSVLGADTAVTGNIEATVDLHVEGRVTGDITCKSLVQGDASEIAGGIVAESVRISGTVRGTIAAREVVILRTARIEGDVSYDALTIEQGARLEGRLNPNGGQTPPAIPQITDESTLEPAE
jgi:cytoskeletal protein CcmA (bactofilin family)